MNDNRGGLAFVAAIRPEDISVNENFDENILHVEIKENAVIVPLPRFVGQNYSLEERQTNSDDGELYEVKISGRFPIEKLSEQDRLKLGNGTWIVFCADYMGNYLIAGTNNVPLLCTIKKETGSIGESFNAATIEFSAIQETPSRLTDISISCSPLCNYI